MTKNVLKTDYHTLQTCLVEIAQVPERLTKCDTTLRKELLEHIDIRIDELIKVINQWLLLDSDYCYPVEHLPKNNFQ